MLAIHFRKGQALAGRRRIVPGRAFGLVGKIELGSCTLVGGERRQKIFGSFAHTLDELARRGAGGAFCVHGSCSFGLAITC